jgi:hypothetical protein
MTFEADEPDVGLVGGWHCEACGYVQPASFDDLVFDED